MAAASAGTNAVTSIAAATNAPASSTTNTASAAPAVFDIKPYAKEARDVGELFTKGDRAAPMKLKELTDKLRGLSYNEKMELLYQEGKRVPSVLEPLYLRGQGDLYPYNQVKAIFEARCAVMGALLGEDVFNAGNKLVSWVVEARNAGQSGGGPQLLELFKREALTIAIPTLPKGQTFLDANGQPMGEAAVKEQLLRVGFDIMGARAQLGKEVYDPADVKQSQWEAAWTNTRAKKPSAYTVKVTEFTLPRTIEENAR